VPTFAEILWKLQNEKYNLQMRLKMPPCSQKESMESDMKRETRRKGKQKKLEELDVLL
jgi:hypothetical protein